MRTDHPLRKTETADISAKELQPGSRLRYEPPEVAGRGYATLLLDSVERGPDGNVVVGWDEGLLNVTVFDSESGLPPLIEDEFDRIQWPDSLSFDPEDSVTVEIRNAAHA